MAQWVYICVTVILAVVPEFCVFLWWASNLSTRLKQLETDKDRLYAEVENINLINTQIAVLEQKVDTQTGILHEIKDQLKGI